MALGVWLVWVGLPAPPPEKARRLVARLSDFDEPYEIGHQIGGELASLGDVGLRALVDGLQREGSGVLWFRVHQVVGHFGPRAREIVPVLVQSAEPSCSIGPYALMALEQIGPHAVEAVPVVIRALRGQDTSLRSLAARVLCRIGPGARAALPALVAGLRDSDARTRWWSAVAIECIDIAAAAREAKPMLVEAAKQTYYCRVRLKAVEALGRVHAWEERQVLPASHPEAKGSGAVLPDLWPGGAGLGTKGDRLLSD